MRRFNSGPDSAQGKNDVPGGHITGVIDAEAQDRKADFLQKPPAPGIIAVDNHPVPGILFAGRKNLLKEPLFRLEVVIHGLMVVQMILCQIGKDTQIEATGVNSSQIHRMR